MSEIDLELYEKMLTIRMVEDRLQQYCLKGEAGDLHFSKGQEAISVGVCSALRSTDYIVTHHRTIAHEIAKGSPLRPLIAEVLGKATGFNKGLAGEMHLSNTANNVRHMFSFQIVATCVPVAVGLAYALKYYKKTDDVVAVFFGDAATSNGQFHEALNIAKIKKVPLLLVCENNGLAGNIRKEMYLPTKTVVERMAAYGIKGMRADGNEVRSIRTFARGIVEWVRENSQPYLLELETTRLCWHKQGQRDARGEEEMAKLCERDPVVNIAKLWPCEAACVKLQVEKEVEAAFAQVQADPEPNYYIGSTNIFI